jgi:peptidoglycan/xylan/chitin deacetylase (PgdA/CDA1 family)
MSTYYRIDKKFFNQSLFSTYTPILVYHNIIADNTPIAPTDCCLTVSQFESQMCFLYEHGYSCLNLMDLIGSSKTKELQHKKTFVLTFDDGFEDFYTLAYPILHKYGFVATIFLRTDIIQNRSNRDSETGESGMTWEQIKFLCAEGFTFGSHTCSHFHLPELPEEQIRHELIASKEYLKTGLGQEVPFLAYPYGDSNLTVQRMAQQIGYQAAFGVITVEPGHFNLWRTELKTKDSMQTFIFKLTRWYSYYIKLRGWVRERTVFGRYLRRVKNRRRQSFNVGPFLR